MAGMQVPAVKDLRRSAVWASGTSVRGNPGPRFDPARCVQIMEMVIMLLISETYCK